ncbi:hypothetical protein C8R44DRAFT_265350 [Mycena epipterygia]|nr:hypothetical protein C8R44DRAFT_265350 [Mycena epipterygia]
MQDIKDKFKALGCDVDPFKVLQDALEKHPSAKQPQPLTPRVWNRIKEPLLCAVGRCKEQAGISGE